MATGEPEERRLGAARAPLRERAQSSLPVAVADALRRAGPADLRAAAAARLRGAHRRIRMRQDLLTRAVVQRLEASRYEIALLTNPHGGRIELLRQVLYELGVETADTTRPELLHTLNDVIARNLQRGRETLIIVDDAQQADDPAWFEELSSLLNIQTNERTLVTLLLAGTPELAAAIHRVQHLDRRVSSAAAEPAHRRADRPVHPLPALGGGLRGLDVHAGRGDADPRGQPRRAARDQ